MIEVCVKIIESRTALKRAASLRTTHPLIRLLRPDSCFVETDQSRLALGAITERYDVIAT